MHRVVLITKWSEGIKEKPDDLLWAAESCWNSRVFASTIHRLPLAASRTRERYRVIGSKMQLYKKHI
jgi:hypothetical protein